MIDTMARLHDFANRMHIQARVPDEDWVGELSTFGTGSVQIQHADDSGKHRRWLYRRVDLLETVELNGLDGWVPLAEFDEVAYEARVRRWDTRHGYEVAADALARAELDLEDRFDELHVFDADAADGRRPSNVKWPPIE